MANGENGKLVAKYLPRLIEWIAAAWKRRREAKAAKP